MAGKGKALRKDVIPGPGTYAPGDTKKAAPNYGIGTSTRLPINDSKTAKAVPGPG